MTYSEMYLLELDEMMKGFKRFQTRGDWEIEMKAKSNRFLHLSPRETMQEDRP